VVVAVQFVAGAGPVGNGVASGRCPRRVVVGMVVGETAGEDDVEKVLTKKETLRYGGGLSGMRAGKYGTGNVRDGSGWRVAGDDAVVVGVERRECEVEAKEVAGWPVVSVIFCLESFVLWQSVRIKTRESSSKEENLRMGKDDSGYGDDKLVRSKVVI
jgi:hypothetical protein